MDSQPKLLTELKEKETWKFDAEVLYNWRILGVNGDSGENAASSDCDTGVTLQNLVSYV